MDIYNNSYYRFTKSQKREAVLANTFMRKFNANDWRLKYLYKHVDSSFTNFGIHVYNPNYTIDVSGTINTSHDYNLRGDGDYDGVLFNFYHLVPTGTIVQYGGSTAPHNWLFCNGSDVSRTTYSGLFAVIGTTYGNGNGTTTFTLPDFRGRMALGVGTGTGLTARTLGQEDGQENITQVPPHTHTITDPGHAHSYQNNINNQQTDNAFATELAADNFDLDQTTGTSTTGITINNTGTNIAGGAVDIMNPFLVVNFIIKW